jgi:retron-type reverse transcriptase
MINFVVVSLFSSVPIRKTMSLLSLHFEDGIPKFFRHVLTASYISFPGQFYEEIDGVSMGSPLSPVITNFFMEDFEKMALNRIVHMSLCWFRYVDNTFFILPQGPDRLRDFLVHLKIQFTMEKETGDHLPFLDTVIYRRPGNTLGHKVCR